MRFVDCIEWKNGGKRIADIRKNSASGDTASAFFGLIFPLCNQFIINAAVLCCEIGCAAVPKHKGKTLSKMRAQIPADTHITPDASGSHVAEFSVLFKIRILPDSVIVSPCIVGNFVSGKHDSIVFSGSVRGDKFTGKYTRTLDREIRPFGIRMSAFPGKVQFRQNLQPFLKFQLTENSIVRQTLP